MNASPSKVVPVLLKVDWTALVSFFLATFLLSGLLFIAGWFAVGHDQVYRFSDALKQASGIDFLFLAALLLVIGTPTALLFGGVGLYRTRKSRGRKGRSFALIGFLFSLVIVLLVTGFFIIFEIVWSHFHLVM